MNSVIPELQATIDGWQRIREAVDVARTVHKYLEPLREDGAGPRVSSLVTGELRRQPIPDPAQVDTAMRAALDLFYSIRHSVEVFDPRCGAPGTQDGEDAILAELLPATVGSYLDIGASEPRECSNTWALYQRGWRGLLVEPRPWAVPALCLQRPGDAVAPLAVMDYDGLVLLRLASSCSSAIPTWNIQEWGKLLVPCVTLSTLLERYPQAARADYVSVDVEGAERFVLAGWPWATFRPRVVSVEHVEYNPTAVGADVSGEWAHLLTDAGYREYKRTKFNIIYTRAT